MQRNAFASCRPSKKPWDGRHCVKSKKIETVKSGKSYQMLI